VDLDEVRAVLDALDAAQCPASLAGGWGVDALAGKQTREHRDLDIFVRAEHEARALTALAVRGYVVETDWRPVRVEVRAPGRGWVDVHPVVFDENGRGRQEGFDGEYFEYLPEDFITGHIGDLRVRCLTAARQLQLHSGYAPRDADLHDLALLQILTPAD
jgi:lincosamide nucleotidyltransferase A/C/D/E